MQNQFKEAAMLERSRKAVLDNADWLTVAEIAERIESNQAHLSELFGQWVRERRIFTIRRDGVDYFPGYGLDAGAGWQPFKGLEPYWRSLEMPGMAGAWLTGSFRPTAFSAGDVLKTH
ncbi:hypothetical protein [Bordetella bronchiseptica]|nr:hypothetical protein [Bordetella bronchiseptica]